MLPKIVVGSQDAHPGSIAAANAPLTDDGMSRMLMTMGLDSLGTVPEIRGTVGSVDRDPTKFRQLL